MAAHNATFRNSGVPLGSVSFPPGLARLFLGLLAVSVALPIKILGSLGSLQRAPDKEMLI